MNIPDNIEKSNSVAQTAFNRAFIPIFIILVGLGAFGLYKLSIIEKNRVPVTIEMIELPTSTTTSVTKVPEKSSTNIVLGPYVASRGGKTYYPIGCTAAQRLSEKNKIFFQSKEEAERFGYILNKSCK